MPVHTCRVLVIEDELPIRMLLCDVLASEGLEVRTARHGLEGLAMLESWRPDLILLDLSMPVMDGWTFRSQQRAAEEISEIPVVVLSAESNLRPRRVRTLEPAAVLTKPCNPDVLVQTVSQLVSPARRGRSGLSRAS